MPLVIVLAYSAASVLLAFLLPTVVSLSAGAAAAVAAGLLLVSAGVHGGWILFARQQRLVRDLDALVREHAHIQAELDRVRTELQSFAETFDWGQDLQRSEAVLKEMRMLESLVIRLWESRGGDRAVERESETLPQQLRAVAGGTREVHEESFETSPTVRPIAPPPGVHVSVITAPVRQDLSPNAVLDIVRDALDLGRVDLYLQPVVELPQRRRRFYECFSRIRDEEGAVVTPEQYIQVAERAGIMGTIDNMLLFRLIQLVRKVQRRNQNVGFFCNISARTLEDEGFFTQFIDFVRENNPLAQNLIFELTQETFATMTPAIERTIESLVRSGFRLSMDRVRDVHLDYARLQELGVRYLKVEADRLVEWIKSLESAGEMQRLRSRLARFGMNLVVEKIEREETLLELLDFRVDYGQGYLFGEPRLSRDTS